MTPQDLHVEGDIETGFRWIKVTAGNGAAGSLEYDSDVTISDSGGSITCAADFTVHGNTVVGTSGQLQASSGTAAFDGTLTMASSSKINVGEITSTVGKSSTSSPKFKCSGTSFTVGSGDVTIEGDVDVSSGCTLAFPASVSVTGTVDTAGIVKIPGSVEIGAELAVASSSKVTVSKTVDVEGATKVAGTLENSGTYMSFADTLEVTGTLHTKTGKLQVTKPTSVSSNGQIKVATDYKADADVHLKDSCTVTVNNAIAVDGSVTVRNSATLDVQNTITVTKDFAVDATLTDQTTGDDSKIAVGGNMDVTGTTVELRRPTTVNGTLTIAKDGRVHTTSIALTTGPMTMDGELHIDSGTVTTTDDVQIAGDVVLNGVADVDGDLDIASTGSLTHDLTADKAKTIELTVTGRLTIETGGTITANRKSRAASSNVNLWSAGYGGESSVGDGCRGDATDPDELGWSTDQRSVRVSNTGTPGYGRVEVRFKSGENAKVWGGVFDGIWRSNWDSTDANVACKEMGYKTGGTAIQENTDGTTYMTGNFYYVAAYATCSGNERHLVDCPVYRSSQFKRSYESNFNSVGYRKTYSVGVRCKGNLPTDDQLEGWQVVARGGGRIKITTGALVLDGRIEAQGFSGASGGTVRVEVEGGSVTGTGVIDVSVVSTATSGVHTIGGGGGGRVAVTGYTAMADTIVANVVMSGEKGQKGAAGTFFIRQRTLTLGDLLARNVIDTSRRTCAAELTMVCKRTVTSAVMLPNEVVECSVSPMNDECPSCTPPNADSPKRCDSKGVPTTAWYDADDVWCRACPLWHICSQSKKEACPADTYNDAPETKSECSQCPALTTTRGEIAQPSIEFCYCTDGKYRIEDPETQSFRCETCSVGHSCVKNLKVPCRPNTYQPFENAAECKACPEGGFTAGQEGSTSISNCTCLPGYYNVVPADAEAKDCQLCQAGYRCSDDLRTACTRVEYQPANNASVCMDCPANSQTVKTASHAAEDCQCDAGFKTILAPLTRSGFTCEPCEEGYRCENGVSTSCDAGTYQPDSGQSTCLRVATY